MPLVDLFIGQFATKYLVGLISVPFMYFNRWIMYGFQKGYNVPVDNHLRHPDKA